MAPQTLNSVGEVHLTGELLARPLLIPHRDVGVVAELTIAQYRPMQALPRVYNVITEDVEIRSELDRGDVIQINGGLGTGNRWNVPIVIRDYSSIADGAAETLNENRVVLTGSRGDLVRGELRGGGELYEMYVTEDGITVCVKTFGDLIEDALDTERDEGVKVTGCLSTRIGKSGDRLTNVIATTIDLPTDD